MKIRDAALCLLILVYSVSAASANSVHGCGGFVEASSSVIKSRKETDTKLDYSHITVELRTVDGLVKERTQCAPNGYYFIPVYDKGSFVIKISGPEGWSWDPDKVPVVIDENSCNDNEDINFRFTGFTLSGRVMGAVGGQSCSLKNGGPANVNVDLLSPNDDLISSELTMPDGSYLFKNIIPGKYKLHASHPDLKIEVRGSTEVELGFQNGIVEDIFFVAGYNIHGSVVAQVTGFSIGGRVVDANDVGVEGVKILVDGQERSITDKEGYYKLDQVTSNHYTIEAIKEHFKFNKLKDYLVKPNMASVSDIKAVSYDVCGVVRTVDSGYKAKVALTHGPENVKPQVKHTDESRKFCFEVPPGEYRISALSAAPESSPELLFLPAYADVVVNGPIFNVEFSQALVNVRGTVVCKEKCGASVSVTLVRLAGKHNERKKIVSLTEERSQFHFPDVLPGKYRLEVKHTSPGAVSKEDNWCWEQSFIDVDVGSEDIEGIKFVQKGYWVNVVSTHHVDAYLTQQDDSPINLKIKKGSQHICVKSPGVHELHFVNSCIFFGSSSMKIDTSNPLPIYLKGEKYLLSGQINVNPSSSNDLPVEIVMNILNSEGTIMYSTNAKLASSANDQMTAVYEYSVWANLGEKLTFLPMDPRNNGEKKFLFYPRLHHVSVTNDGCQASVPPFSGRLGLYLEGSVSPAISGVHIQIIAGDEGSITSVKKGGVVLETATEAEGSYVAGPLYDDITYNIRASKPGFHLKQVGPYSFSCQKLSQISVKIYSKDDATEPMPSVLLSLSGDDGYRNNSMSGTGGIFVFENLFPGSFYLRPLLKEYAFSPSAQAIELGSGESREVVFHATRVAYSAMGTVTLLSGQPKEGVSIEARSESKGYYEETVTDSSGGYRLRGLVPDALYSIKVVKKDGLGSAKIERASPESVPVKVGNNDIKGLEFLVFEEPEMTILSGHVEANRTGELHSHLLVEIKSAGDTSKVESVFQLPLSNFFQVKDLPRGKHTVQLKSNLPSSTHKFESEVIEVDLEKNAQVHVGPLKYSVEEYHHKQELTPAPVFPLIVGVSVIILFLSIPRLKDIYQAATGIPTPGFMTTAKKEPRKPVVRKKTF
ncbi:hypothetical protein ES288_A08G142500v1 [Gossypium darwinii]|uniref:Carbohydrate-binding-like fold protein n=1 Tax=Gossypium darwinii TaxID=34276 RepID=A0A5D2FP36_GOSDA|nr:hypothetical protein ES288_A08G142500v1 [Gossypium darwinii]